MLRDILGTKDKGIPEAVAIIAKADPDVLLLTSFDYDYGGVALRAFADLLADAGSAYPHVFAGLPNGGLQTGLDLDGDGRVGGPRDAQGYGWFAGDNGMVLLSRWAISDVTEYTETLWSTLPGSKMTEDDTAIDVQRLSSSAHWVATLQVDGRALRLGAFAATPPVFDGPEDRNGRRNGDEVAFWRHYIDGRLTGAPVERRFVVMGNANLDPDRGEGLHEEMRALLDHPLITDPLPDAPTVKWEGPGEMRVSYILPSRDLDVLQAGVMDPGADTGPHRLVWVDVELGR